MHESNRKTDSKESKEWTSEFIPRVRYGNFCDKDIEYLKKSTATHQETLQDPAWKNKTIMCARHYHSEKNPEVINVDTLNMKHLIDYGNENNLPVVKISTVFC